MRTCTIAGKEVAHLKGPATSVTYPPLGPASLCSHPTEALDTCVPRCQAGGGEEVQQLRPPSAGALRVGA